jgi:glycosyltransferase involved in cell wall biosynthesis
MKNMPLVQSAVSPEGPFITIAIPTFNRARWLKDCVAAALGQSYPNFEVVVSDNASTDATPDVLRGFNHPKLRVIRQQTNNGAIWNWNACLAEAKGEYVVFVSDDERITARFLEQCTTLIRCEPQIPVVITLCDVHIVALNRTWRAPLSTTLKTGVCSGVDVLLALLRDQIPAAMCSILMSTEKLRARGGFPAEFPFAGDMMIVADLLLVGHAGFVNEACATAWTHDENESAKIAIDTRLRGLQNFIDRVGESAELAIDSARKKADVKRESKRYFVRHAVKHISSCRKEGANATAVLLLIWRFRRNWTEMGIRNAFGSVRSIAIILIPGPMFRWLRRLKRALRESIGDVPKKGAVRDLMSNSPMGDPN